MVQFSDLGIEPSLVSCLADQGITEPFEVQIEAIPSAMEGRDICCRAPTGSGKTLAFGLPLISRTLPAKPKKPTALILTPTRELAEQIRNVLDPLAWDSRMKVLSVYGGTSYGKQLRGLEKGVEILVACPGRLLDLLKRKALSLEDVSIVVLDEADRMADMGFMEPVCRIIDKCTSEPQMILFSATLDRDVSKLVKSYQDDPVRIEVGPKEISMDSMEHLFWNVKPHNKTEVAVKSVRRSGRSIIFCRTRAGVDRLSDEMQLDSVALSSLHGGLNQKQRDRAMRKFSSGRSMVLVATDVAARGIDVEGINCVIHYDPPDDAKAYKHRSGRTARAGNSGVVISFVKRNEQRSYNRIQREVGIRKRFTDPRPEELKKNEFNLIPSSEKGEGNSSGRKKRSRRGRSRNSKRNGFNKGSDDNRSKNYGDKGNRRHRRKSRNKKADARP
ncbi:MAG TPA: DEAD/DEAH box helicase [Candidatus Thalassarchaeaceae archaeon]|nr:RNA helicase [Euryarchaeota archaeon]DAC43048.1 MAG TPA: DEAD/DEAH box helicase [Candidatus Poseidoniales archaeon]HII35209.1 DEAD/DEAH box helicase [Candidatus Thalassarchaeaceae archaeon]